MTGYNPKTALGLAGGLTKAFINSALTPLFILASLAVGLVALTSLPREEEPQISVPLVDIHVQAQGLRAEDGVKLVTEPLKSLSKPSTTWTMSIRPPAMMPSWSRPASMSAPNPKMPFCACMKNCAPIWTACLWAFPNRW
jgi:hypothetical protein